MGASRFLIKYFITEFQNQSLAQSADMPITSGLRRLRQNCQAAAGQPSDIDSVSGTKQWPFPLLEGLPAGSKFYCGNRKETATVCLQAAHLTCWGERGTADVPAALLGCVFYQVLHGKNKVCVQCLAVLACLPVCLCHTVTGNSLKAIPSRPSDCCYLGTRLPLGWKRGTGGHPVHHG